MSQNGSGWAWIFGVIVFLLCLNATYALIELVVGGHQSSINILSLLGGTYDVPVSVYVLTSMLTAAASFSFLYSSFVRKLTMETASAKMLDALESKLHHNRGQIEKVVTKKFANLSMNDFKITEDLKNIEMQIGENQRRLEKIGETRNKYGRTMENQIVALEDMKKKLEKIELRLTPKPRLTSRSDIQEVSGVGQKTAEELKSVGITNVERLIIEDPAVIAKKTELSKNKIEKIQSTAQLLMIPKIDENKAKLLQKAGITSADTLASQNPIQLFKKIASVAKSSDDAPTLEEIASYIKFARSNLIFFY
ncbi:DUF4332 domain-containing protein [Candidatus Bathyarchaeota archaeon]|nr:DUF4332 domain-containing protein [Candidatus Bathyarchaeota archaeon]MCK4482715.1 DUF4332 domain-containing protein [Candidatus Bathyarchaeota archaeon]